MENYHIQNINELDSPALVVFPEIVKENIKKAVVMVGAPTRLWPHIKTHKTLEVIKLCQTVGIENFKCATIAEAELLGMAGVKTALLAYQPVGPKQGRFLALIKKYPNTHFSCLIDDYENAKTLSDLAKNNSTTISIYIDLNIGQNRTGILREQASNLIEKLQKTQYLKIEGIHAYDGHIHDAEEQIRIEKAEKAYQIAKNVKISAESLLGYEINLIISGSPTFPFHAKRNDVVCSPGTFVFWDSGYSNFTDQNFKPAVLVVTRIISKPAEDLICTDLGHKSISAERNITERIILFDKNLTPISQSEEHLVLKTPDNNNYKIGQVLFGFPYHICPTVALYNQIHVVENEKITGETWQILGRKREISI